MQLWQMDVMGGVVLEDGTDLKVVTGIDDHSRFCVVADLGILVWGSPLENEELHNRWRAPAASPSSVLNE